MTRFFFLATAILVLVLGILYGRERSHNRDLVAETTKLRQENAQHSQQLQARVQEITQLVQDNTKLATKEQSRRQKQSALRAAASAATADASSAGNTLTPPTVPAPPAATEQTGNASPPASGVFTGLKGPFAQSVKAMMADPAMRDMMRTGQAMAMKTMYADLAKQWKLSPEDTQSFYDLLLDQQAAILEHGQTYLDGKQPEDSSNLAAAVTDADATLRSSLGESRYADYLQYKKMMPDRLALNQLKQQLATDDRQPLTPDQSTYVLKVLGEERQSSTGLATLGQGLDFTEGKLHVDANVLDHYSQAQAAENERVVQRLAGVLTPEQLASFKQQQQQALDTQKAGLQMATVMFGNKP